LCSINTDTNGNTDGDGNTDGNGKTDGHGNTNGYGNGNTDGNGNNAGSEAAFQSGNIGNHDRPRSGRHYAQCRNDKMLFSCP
jgi:hypothetical protein